MIDVPKLKGAIVAAGHTQRSLAKEMGISEATMYNKTKAGVFGSDEIAKMIDILKLPQDEWPDIFFAKENNQQL